MSTSTTFPMSAEITNMQAILRQNRDIRGGKAAMFANRETYFRRLSGQSDDDYDTMIDMAQVYTLYPKVVDGFTGTIFRKPIILTGADSFDQKNVDLLGNTLQEYCQQITQFVFEDGFCATMLDWSNVLNRSFYKLVKPEQFVSFLTDNSKGYPELSRFIFKEMVEEQSIDDEFSTADVQYHTVIDFTTISNDQGESKRVVRLRRYLTLHDDGDENEELVSTSLPTKNGDFLTKLPLIIHSIKPNNFTVEKSPLQDISDLNIAVDQRVIDLVYLLHWTALPTPWATGVDPSDENAPSSIGPTQAWLIANDAAKVGMMEFSGKSYEAHINYISKLENTMATIGAQILSPQAVSRETASSVIIRTSAQTSLIATIVDNLSSQMKELIQMKMDWDNDTYSEDMTFTLNRDFIIVELPANEQIALVKSWLDGAISFDTMFTKMKEGEIITSTRTMEEELELIKENPPPFFKENLQSELAVKENEGGANNQPAKNNTTGNSLETGNEIDNPAQPV